MAGYDGAVYDRLSCSLLAERMGRLERAYKSFYSVYRARSQMSFIKKRQRARRAFKGWEHAT